jgi:hypothetical protein
VFRTRSSSRLLFSRLLFQLVPAVAVSAVGIALLNRLAEPADVAPPVPAAVDTAITAEMVFTPTQRAAAEPQPEAAPNRARPAPAKPAKAVASAPPVHHEVAVAALPPPPPVVLHDPEPPVARAENPAMAKLRGFATAVQRIPGRTLSTVASWFDRPEPIRPPADVPAQNLLNASM